MELLSVQQLFILYLLLFLCRPYEFVCLFNLISFQHFKATTHSKNRHTFSNGNRFRTTGVTVQYPLLLQPCHCNVCRMCFCIVLLRNAWVSLEKMLPWCCFKICVLFCIDADFAKGTDSSRHDRPFWTGLWQSGWPFLFLVWSKNDLEYWFLWPEYTCGQRNLGNGPP